MPVDHAVITHAMATTNERVRDRGLSPDQILWRGSEFLASRAILHALGASESSDSLRLVIEGREGDSLVMLPTHPFARRRPLGGNPNARAPLPTMLRATDAPFSVQWLSAERVLYVEFNNVVDARDETATTPRQEYTTAIPNTREMTRRPTHPGEMLREDFLPDYGLSVAGLAEAAGVSRQSVNELLRGRRAISPEMALRLSRLFGNSPEFWMNAQRAIDLWEAKRAIKADVARIKPLRVA